MYQSTQSAIPKSHRLGGVYTTETYFSQSRRLGSPRSEHQEIQSGDAIFLLFPRVAEGVRGHSQVSFIRALIPFTRALPSHPNNGPKFPPPDGTHSPNTRMSWGHRCAAYTTVSGSLAGALYIRRAKDRLTRAKRTEVYYRLH